MRKPIKWWQGLLFYAGVQLVEFGIRSAVRKGRVTREGDADRRFYRVQKQPVFAPPGIAFPIAWGINSASSIAGGIHALNMRPKAARNSFLRWQGAAWVLFSLFNTAYFELKSPINALAVTLGYTLATVASLRAAMRAGDARLMLSLASTAGWLCLANPVAVCVAAWNRDEFWNAGPFVKPPKALVKG